MIEEAKREGIRRYGVWAMISENRRVLLVRRQKDDFLGGVYEFPGGTVEAGEALSDALAREVKEETGLNLKRIGEFISFFDYDSENGERTRVFTFHVELHQPLKIRLSEHDHFVWVDKAGVAGLSLNEPILHALEEFGSRMNQRDQLDLNVSSSGT
jgi:8-oxo-dGTP diphosphatase